MVVLLFTLAACGGGTSDDDGVGDAGTLAGRIEADGSSTVAPFIALAAERFQREHSRVSVTVGVFPSRTGGGFERFCAGESDLASASRPIAPHERRACRRNGVRYIAFQVANDALMVVVNAENHWIDCITVRELKRTWQQGSRVETWSDIRAGFPPVGVELFGADRAAGTFDYFVSRIVGRDGEIRSDYVPSRDDVVTVQRVAGSSGAMAFFGLPYYENNTDGLKALAIDSGSGCVVPSVETAQSGAYVPLSRPLFIYARADSFRARHVRAFVEYALAEAVRIAEDVHLVPLTPKQRQRERARFDEALHDLVG
jgi:phosphate transport system substrate-binding protein